MQIHLVHSNTLDLKTQFQLHQLRIYDQFHLCVKPLYHHKLHSVLTIFSQRLPVHGVLIHFQFPQNHHTLDNLPILYYHLFLSHHIHHMLDMSYLHLLLILYLILFYRQLYRLIVQNRYHYIHPLPYPCLIQILLNMCLLLHYTLCRLCEHY